MVVTPGDILGRCKALEARIEASDKVVRAASEAELDATFRQAWNARLRRWLEVREQCAEWASRLWNTKWGPILDNWLSNQAQWEADIERRTKRAVPVPAIQTAYEELALPTLPNAPKPSVGLGIGIGVAAVTGVVVVGWALSRRKAG